MWSYAFHTRAASQGIAEWAHASLAVPRDDVFAGVLLVGLAIGLARRRYTAVLPFVAAGVLAADAVRCEVYLLLVGIGLLAAAVDRARSVRVLELAGRVAVLTTVLVLGAVGVLGPPGGRDNTLTGLDPAFVPTRQIASLPRGCRLLDSYDLGGWVIWLRPGLRVSLDPRNDLYGAAALRTQVRVDDGDQGALSWVARHDVTCALLVPRSGLVAELEAQHWQVVSTGKAAIALVAPRGAHPGQPAGSGPGRPARSR